MNRLLTAAIVIIGIGASLGWRAPVNAQPAPTQSTIHAPRPPSGALSENLVREKLNTWTVGLAGGQLEGAPIRLAAEIGRVVDDGDNLHVLSIVTRGPTENVEDLLYLKGVDVAIINTDALDQFRQLVPDIQQRITYILSLFPSEVHIFVRPEITSLADLKDGLSLACRPRKYRRRYCRRESENHRDLRADQGKPCNQFDRFLGLWQG